MKSITIATATFAVAVMGLSGCGGGTTNVTVNSNANRGAANSVANSMGNAVNSVSNAVNSATNTVANTAASVTTPDPETFMKDAAHSGVAEVELGKLASTKGQNAEVKSYGRMMITDHSKANAELKALAAKKNITLPTDLGPHAGTAEKLKGQSGAEFDGAYVEAMIAAHQKDVSNFQAQADNATDPEVKAFAAKTLPTLKAHLEKIQGIQSKLNGQPAAGNTANGAARTAPANR